MNRDISVQYKSDLVNEHLFYLFKIFVDLWMSKIGFSEVWKQLVELQLRASLPSVLATKISFEIIQIKGYCIYRGQNLQENVQIWWVQAGGGLSTSRGGCGAKAPLLSLDAHVFLLLPMQLAKG